MRATRGHLVIIGGGEDREDDKAILTRIVALAGGKKAKIVVLTTASRQAALDPEVAKDIEATYRKAFLACGAASVTALHLFDRQSANTAESAQAILNASCIFIAGGNQSRLVSIIGGTAVERAMHTAYLEHGACISGTSAGASAITEHMVAGGPSDPLPRKGLLPLAPGLGFLHHVIIDQHFSERQRLGRMLGVLAQNPFLMGIGIDEDTALVVCPDATFEVVGSGAVTLIDGRDMDNRAFNEVEDGDPMLLTDLRLHLLPTGFKFDLRKARGVRDPNDPVISVTFIDALASIVGNC
ncbi:MAG: cyanophycinase [Cyanobacteria bacterium RYN_339]|nr:cyanophycinase [Cyanobacteria bacterium RYN_339]